MKKLREKINFYSNSVGMKMQTALKTKRKGAFAFEYIIILSLMVVVIFGAWKVLGTAVTNKVASISNFMNNNGI